MVPASVTVEGVIATSTVWFWKLGPRTASV
jgi:hypothetical protein